MRLRLEFPVLLKSPAILGLYEIHRGQRVAVVGEGTDRMSRDVTLEPCRGVVGYLDIARGRSSASTCLVLDPEDVSAFDIVWHAAEDGSLSVL